MIPRVDPIQRGKPILYWADMGASAFERIICRQWLSPQDFVRRDVPLHDVIAVADALRGGSPVTECYGYANCRMCRIELGYRDMGGYGFVWPEKAEHYLLVHNVWTPDCDELLAALRAPQQNKATK